MFTSADHLVKERQNFVVRGCYNLLWAESITFLKTTEEAIHVYIHLIWNIIAIMNGFFLFADLSVVLIILQI